MSKSTITAGKYMEFLEKRGYQELGSGVYSTVYAHPKRKDIAVKVFHHDYMDTWPDYIAWATENGYGGNFAPKVYSLKHHGDFYVATMERLAITFEEALPELSHTIKKHRLKQHSIIRYPYDYDDEKHYKRLRAFAHDLHDAGFGHDLHDKNVMLRKNGHVVVTDAAGGSSSDSSRSTRIKRGKLVSP